MQDLIVNSSDNHQLLTVAFWLFDLLITVDQLIRSDLGYLINNVAHKYKLVAERKSYRAEQTRFETSFLFKKNMTPTCHLGYEFQLHTVTIKELVTLLQLYYTIYYTHN